MRSGEHDLWDAHMEVAPIRAATTALVTWAESLRHSAQVLAIAVDRAAMTLGDELRAIDRRIGPALRDLRERP